MPSQARERHPRRAYEGGIAVKYRIDGVLYRL